MNPIKSIIYKFLRKIGRKFQNFVFRHRLGKTDRAAKFLFRIMDIFDRFEVYVNSGETGGFDHYVPQFVLKNWMISGGDYNKRVWVWSKEDGSVKPEAVKSVGGEVDWDVTHAQGVPSDFVKKKLFAELLEQKTAEVIKLIQADSAINLTVLEEGTLAVFIGHQITRVPSFRKSLRRYFSVGVSRGHIQIEDFGNRDVLSKKVVENTIGLTYDQCVDEKASVRIEEGKPQVLMLSMLIGSAIGEQIFRGNLHILQVPDNSPEEFVISDNPVVIFDFERQKYLRFVPWWEIGKKDFWIFMPISPKKAIWFSKSKRKDGRVEKDAGFLVEGVNFAQYQNCTNMAFATNEQIIHRHLSMYSTELRNGGNV